MRAIRARYDPYEQARGRVNQLRDLGHSVDKVEIMYVAFLFLFWFSKVFPLTGSQYHGRNVHVHAGRLPP